jgi:hypothetical protein
MALCLLLNSGSYCFQGPAILGNSLGKPPKKSGKISKISKSNGYSRVLLLLEIPLKNQEKLQIKLRFCISEFCQIQGCFILRNHLEKSEKFETKWFFIFTIEFQSHTIFRHLLLLKTTPKISQKLE